MIAEVAVGLPIDKTFNYSVPEALKNRINAGKRVWVPFGQKRMVGYVVGLNAASTPGVDTPGVETGSFQG